MTQQQKANARFAAAVGAGFIVGSMSHKAAEPSMGWWPALLVGMVAALIMATLVVWVMGRVVKSNSGA